MVHLPDSSFSAEQLSSLAEALQLIEKAFPGYNVRLEKDSAARNGAPVVSAPTARRTAAKEPASGTNRSLVLNATKGMFLTVEEIAAATGLDPKKIRGVLNSPDLNFDKIQSSGVVGYQFSGASNKRRKEAAS